MEKSLGLGPESSSRWIPLEGAPSLLHKGHAAGSKFLGHVFLQSEFFASGTRSIVNSIAFYKYALEEDSIRSRVHWTK